MHDRQILYWSHEVHTQHIMLCLSSLISTVDTALCTHTLIMYSPSGNITQNFPLSSVRDEASGFLDPVVNTWISRDDT